MGLEVNHHGDGPVIFWTRGSRGSSDSESVSESLAPGKYDGWKYAQSRAG